MRDGGASGVLARLSSLDCFSQNRRTCCRSLAPLLLRFLGFVRVAIGSVSWSRWNLAASGGFFSAVVVFPRAACVRANTEMRGDTLHPASLKKKGVAHIHRITRYNESVLNPTQSHHVMVPLA